MSKTASIGVTGLAVMGRNLARNLARHGHTVALHNRSEQRTRDLVEQFGDEGDFVPAYSAQEFVDAGCGEFVLWFRDAPSSHSLEAFARDVIPLVKG